MDRCQDGYIAAILADEGTKDIPVGTPMAVMVDDKVRPSQQTVMFTRLHPNTLSSYLRQSIIFQAETVRCYWDHHS